MHESRGVNLLGNVACGYSSYIVRPVLSPRDCGYPMEGVRPVGTGCAIVLECFRVGLFGNAALIWW
jgi:hypothetical protein